MNIASRARQQTTKSQKAYRRARDRRVCGKASSNALSTSSPPRPHHKSRFCEESLLLRRTLMITSVQMMNSATTSRTAKKTPNIPTCPFLTSNQNKFYVDCLHGRIARHGNSSSGCVVANSEVVFLPIPEIHGACPCLVFERLKSDRDLRDAHCGRSGNFTVAAGCRGRGGWILPTSPCLPAFPVRKFSLSRYGTIQRDRARPVLACLP